MPLDPVKPIYVRTTRPHRRRGRIGALIGFFLMLALVGGVLGSAAVYTNAFGVGERFDNLKDRVALFLNPPPDRDVPPDEEVTPPPDEADASEDPEATLEPTPSVSVAAGETPPPTPKPTPKPPKKKVDIDILKARNADPKDFFNSEIDKEWCAPAATQIALDILGLKNATDAFQRELVDRIDEWESWRDSHNGDWGPTSMALALKAYGAEGYKVMVFGRREDALRESAKAIMKTGAPVILLAWRGAHAWVMSGFRATADPTIWKDAKVTGAYILDPWFPRISSIWGPSDGPGVFQDEGEMVRNYLPWQRPEGAYPNRDGKFIAVVPTRPTGKSKPLTAG